MMSRTALVLALLLGILSVGAQGRELLQEAAQTIIQGQISAGASHTCSIKSDGSAWCWGSNEYGQLGDGSSSSKETPVIVSGGGSWLQISVGPFYTCGLRTDSTAWCWGNNYDGQLGNGVFQDFGVRAQDSKFPAAVAGGGTWLQISGYYHTCGIKTDGSAWCWGFNENGRLGDGTSTSKSIPTIVTGGGTWLQISAGFQHTCGIKADSSGWCWGRTYSGVDQLAPTILFDSSVTWLQISAGYGYTWGIQSDRSLWCWRVDTDYIGDTVLPDNSGIPTVTSGGQSWLQVSVGEDFVCGITSDFSAWCWGANPKGQVGDGSSGNIRQSPAKVYGGYNWKEVSTGENAACGITQQGEAMCWGSNSASVIEGDTAATPLGSSGPTTNIPRAVSGNGPWGQEQETPPQPSPVQDLSPSPSNSVSSPPDDIVSTSSTSIATVVGGVVGGIAVLAASAAFTIWRKRRSSTTPPPVPSTETTPTMEKAPTRPEDSAALALSLSSLPSLSSSTDPVLQWVASNSAASAPAMTRRRSQPPMPSNMTSLAFTWPEVRVLKALGLGSFGKVYLGTLNHTPVALKLLIDARAAAAVTTSSAAAADATHDSEAAPAVASYDALVAESSILASLRHPNVALLVGYCLNPPCLALEYASRGSLFDVLKKAAADPAAAAELTWHRRLGMAADAAAGMLHLHTRSPPILHRDLKSPNLLVTAEWTVKVTDMGLSKVTSEATLNSSVTTAAVHNPRWLANEVLDGARASSASDVFSFGVVMWELLTWKLPWENVPMWTIVGGVLRGDRPEVPAINQLPGERIDGAAMEAYVGLMRRCWAQVLGDRPSFEVVASELRALGA